MKKVIFALVGLSAASCVSAFIPPTAWSAKLQTRSVSLGAVRRAGPALGLRMSLTEPENMTSASESRRDILIKSLAASFLFSPASVRKAYADDDEEEDVEEEAPQPKVSRCVLVFFWIPLVIWWLALLIYSLAWCYDFAQLFLVSHEIARSICLSCVLSSLSLHVHR